MPHSFLTRVRLLVVVLFAVLALPGASLAAPPTFHGPYEFSQDVVICGVAGTIHVSGAEAYWEDGASFKVRGQGTDTFTATDGRTVIFHHGGLLNFSYTDHGDGTATIVEDYRGLAGSTRGAGGGPVLRDVGIIVFTTLWDYEAEEVIWTEVTLVHGPHPEADSGFEEGFFCDAFLEALG